MAFLSPQRLTSRRYCAAIAVTGADGTDKTTKGHPGIRPDLLLRVSNDAARRSLTSEPLWDSYVRTLCKRLAA